MKVTSFLLTFVGLLSSQVLVGTAFAEKSSDLMLANPRAAYKVVKSFLDSQRKDGNLQVRKLKLFGIFDCRHASDVYPVEGALERTLVDAAFQVIMARQILSSKKYPRELWRDALVAFEDSYLNWIVEGYRIGESDYETTRALRTKLVREINSRVSKSSLKLSPLPVNPECDIEITRVSAVTRITVRVRPHNAAVSVIPKMFYSYCRASGMNPDDKTKCDYWLPAISDGEQVHLGGIYKYQIERQGGTTPVREIDADRVIGLNTLTFE
jgi:hypothetical protein